MNEHFEVRSEADLIQVVEALRVHLKPGDWVKLEGDLGAGKTTFVRHLFRHLGYEETVVSPSYPLLVEYEIGGQKYLHLDGYRLQPGQIQPWDYREWADAIVLAEWVEKLELPVERFRLGLQFIAREDGSRKISLKVGPNL